MTTIAKTIAYVLACILACACVVACASQAQVDAGHELAAASVAATDASSPGGATITPEEQEQLAAIYERLKGADGLDWRELGGAALASLAMLFPALRYLPNSLIIGRKEAAHLEKAAGIT